MTDRPPPTGELLDAGLASAAVVAENLHDMKRLLRLLGVHRQVHRFLGRLPFAPGKQIRLLDLAAGSGWVARTAVHWGDQRGLPVEVTALDVNRVVVRQGRRMTPANQGIDFVCGDALRLPFDCQAFDITLCTMALHHFEPTQGVQLLRECDRVATRGWLLCDLLRSPLLTALSLAATRAFSRNPLTRHDGPLSARRSYTLDELRGLVSHSGVAGVRYHRFSWICAALWNSGSPQELARRAEPGILKQVCADDGRSGPKGARVTKP